MASVVTGLHGVFAAGSLDLFLAGPRPLSGCAAIFERERFFAGRRPRPLMSAHGASGVRFQAVKAMKAGALDFFQKPFREQALLDAIADALKRDAQPQA
jgi:CheY-like chemotaxis protein